MHYLVCFFALQIRSSFAIYLQNKYWLINNINTIIFNGKLSFFVHMSTMNEMIGKVNVIAAECWYYTNRVEFENGEWAHVYTQSQYYWPTKTVSILVKLNTSRQVIEVIFFPSKYLA